jgi:hypothetical protein
VSPKVGETWILCDYYGIVTIKLVDQVDGIVRFLMHKNGIDDWCGTHWFDSDRDAPGRFPVALNISFNLGRLVFIGE